LAEPIADEPAPPAESVPDAEIPSFEGEATDYDTAPPEEDLDEELFLGSEATVPEGDYGPPIESRLPDRTAITSELRELERRVRSRLVPSGPTGQRRQVPLAFLWSRYRQFAMRDRSDVVDEFGRDPVYSARFEPILEFLYRKYFRVECEGLENVPSSGRALLVANHSGTLPYDGAIVMHAMRSEHAKRRDVRPLVEDFVFHFPYVGTLINRLGGVRACQENAQRLLDADQLVAVFPEGIKGIGKLYRDRYKLQRFGRGGFIKLALRTRSPIVPVAIVGAEETHPMLTKITWLSKSVGIPYLPITPTFPFLGPLGLLPLPAKWFVRFGEVIDVPGEHGPEAASDRILVNRLAETVRSRIQTMIDEALEHRKSVLLG
jgi:1-acyl-sn-glycerol-3-phosphate acyltransferase